MRRLAIAAVAVAALAAVLALRALGVISLGSPGYSRSTPALAAAFRAKEGCTCLFLHGRPEPDCLEWTRVSPDVASMEVDPVARTVTSRALLFWSARARLVSPREGCRLE